MTGGTEFFSSGGHHFHNLEPLTDGTIGDVSSASYDGADPDDIDQEILAKLGVFIRSLDEEETPVVTNFFTEFKLITSDMLVASRQARYAGAIGARATHKLRSFEIEDLKVAYDNKAYIITAIFRERFLRLYAHRPIRPLIPGGSTHTARVSSKLSA